MTEPKAAAKPKTGRKATKTQPSKPKAKSKGRGKLAKPPMASKKTPEEIILASLSEEQKAAIVRQHKCREMFGFFKADLEELGYKVGKTIILDVEGAYHDPETYNISEEMEDDDEDDDAEREGDIDDDEDDVTVALDLWMDEYDKSQKWVAGKLKVTQGCVSSWLREDGSYPREATRAKIRKLVATKPGKRGRPRKS